jgi:hypothetical protein
MIGAHKSLKSENMVEIKLYSFFEAPPESFTITIFRQPMRILHSHTSQKSTQPLWSMNVKTCDFGSTGIVIIFESLGGGKSSAILI